MFSGIDIALLAATIGSAVEEAAASEDEGPRVIVMPIERPGEYHIFRGDARDIAILAELTGPGPASMSGPDLVGDVLRPRTLNKLVPKRQPRRKPANVSPTKEAPKKTPKRKPPTRRKRRP